MIRPLRSRHRWMVAGVALVVVPLFVAGLRARKIDDRAVVRHDDPFASRIQGDDWNESWDGAGLGSRLVWGPATDARSGERALYWAIVEREPLVVADPLVYHHNGAVAVGDALPTGAVFLGAFRSGDTFTAFAPTTTREGGTLFIVSLAHGEVVATHAVTP